jgi:hypothetical protein
MQEAEKVSSRARHADFIICNCLSSMNKLQVLYSLLLIFLLGLILRTKKSISHFGFVRTKDF